MVGNFQRAYFFLYEFAVEITVGTTSLVVELETDVDIGHFFLQHIYLHLIVCIEQLVAQRIESDRTVHGSCVNINVTYFLGQVLGHSAFAT